MATTRYLKGDQVTFTIDGEDVTLDATRALITHAEDNEGLVTFAAAKLGGVFKGTLSITAAQSDDADSWETFVWIFAVTLEWLRASSQELAMQRACVEW